MYTARKQKPALRQKSEDSGNRSQINFKARGNARFMGNKSREL